MPENDAGVKLGEATLDHHHQVVVTVNPKRVVAVVCTPGAVLQPGDVWTLVKGVAGPERMTQQVLVSTHLHAMRPTDGVKGYDVCDSVRCDCVLGGVVVHTISLYCPCHRPVLS